MEVLTDGASALYGSDAVGGVVNLILRNDFEGAETRMRYGSVTQGHHNELQVGQLLGHSWNSGQALLTYDYLDRTALEGADRDYFDESILFPELRLIPEQQRHGALAVVEQRLTDWLMLTSDFLYADRSSMSAHMLYEPQEIESSVSQLGASLGLKLELPNAWQLRTRGIVDRTKSDHQTFHGVTGERLETYAHETELTSLELSADGPVLHVPGGAVRLALGAQKRKEELLARIGLDARIDRTIDAIYAELSIPVVGEQNRTVGIDRLEFTTAARYEDYSDFGSTFNPKLGFSWAPTEGLNVRGTWGTSFKAPLLEQQNPGQRGAQLITDVFADEFGPTPILYLSGNSENLRPEESKNWTVGLDLMPASIPGLEISTTYFDIDYRDRLRTPFPNSYNHLGVLLDPLYAFVVDRQIDAATVKAIMDSTPNAFCATSSALCNPTDYLDDVTAIVNARLRNLAGVEMSGIDFSVRYPVESVVGNWGFNLGGSYLLKNRHQLAPELPEVSQLNQVYEPVDLRLNSSVSFSRGALSVVSALNYTDNYRDTRDAAAVGASVKRSRVSSWTTVDLTVQYDLSRYLEIPGFSLTSLQLTATNLLDRDPPYVASRYGLHFDGVNANPLGRFVSAQLTARWGH